MLRVGLVGNIDLAPEEFLEVLEVLDDLVSCIGGNIPERQGQLEVVLFVCKEGGHASGRVGGIVAGKLGKG